MLNYNIHLSGENVHACLAMDGFFLSFEIYGVVVVSVTVPTEMTLPQ